jgi:hypothetical protein
VNSSENDERNGVASTSELAETQHTHRGRREAGGGPMRGGQVRGDAALEDDDDLANLPCTD